MPRCLSAVMKSAATLLLLALISGCSAVYKLPIYQGNYIDQEKVDQLEVGMRPDQVRFLLGTPLVDDVSSNPRWDYVAYYKSPRGKESRRVLTLWFENGLVSRIDGRDNPFGPPAVENDKPDSGEDGEDKRAPARPASEERAPQPGEDV